MFYQLAVSFLQIKSFVLNLGPIPFHYNYVSAVFKIVMVLLNLENVYVEWHTKRQVY